MTKEEARADMEAQLARIEAVLTDAGLGRVLRESTDKLAFDFWVGDPGMPHVLISRGPGNAFDVYYATRHHNLDDVLVELRDWLAEI